MRDYFKEQLDKAEPLTQKLIDKMNKARLENGCDLTDYNVGDVLLYMIVKHQCGDVSELRVTKILESELDNDDYEFVRIAGTTPIFKLKDTK